MKSLEYKVGALIVISLVLLGGFLALLGNFSLRGGTRIRIDYDFSGNLQSGAPVKISGIKVGKVEEVRYLGGAIDPDTGKRVQVRVVALVEDRVKESIRKNAEFFINTAGRARRAVPRDRSPAAGISRRSIPRTASRASDPPRTDLIVARLYEFLDSITGLLRDDKDVIKDFLQSGASVVRTLDDLLKTNKAEIGRLLGNVDALSKQAADLLGTIRAGVGDASTLKATLGNIEALTASIRRDIDPLIAKAKKALDGVDRVTSVVGPGERDKLQKALDELVTVGDKAEKLTSDAQAIVADVQAGQGHRRRAPGRSADLRRPEGAGARPEAQSVEVLLEGMSACR